MKLSNNSPTAAYYSVSFANSAGCGTIEANQTIDFPI